MSFVEYALSVIGISVATMKGSPLRGLFVLLGSITGLRLAGFAGEVLAGGTFLLPVLFIIACAFGFGCLLLLIRSLHRSGVLTPLGPVEARQVKQFAGFLLSASFIAGLFSEYNTSWSLHVVETPLAGLGAKIGETVLIDMPTKRQRAVAVTALERGDQNPIHTGRYGVFLQNSNLVLRPITKADILQGKLQSLWGLPTRIVYTRELTRFLKGVSNKENSAIQTGSHSNFFIVVLTILSPPALLFGMQRNHFYEIRFKSL